MASTYRVPAYPADPNTTLAESIRNSASDNDATVVPGDRRRRRLLTATIGAGLSGALLGLLMPRGPMSTRDALLAIAIGLVTGLASGWWTRSRWLMLLGPVAHLLVFELVRSPTDGPLVDGIHLGTTWGLAAFVFGRLFNGILVVIPMLLGVSLGAAGARRKVGTVGPEGLRLIGLWLRRFVAAGTALSLLAFMWVLTRPAMTPPIRDAAGRPVAGSIASLERVRLGGHDQWISIRGWSTGKPILLHLAGGPGQSDLGYIRALWGDIERDMIVVDWDQRGTGKSYSALDPTSTWSLSQAVNDTLELTNYLRIKFGQDKIYLIGESWGTILGTLAVQQRPDLFHAYIGGGQMVDVRETDQLLYDEMLTYARTSRDSEAEQRMLAYGRPPYEDVFANAFVMSYYDALNPHRSPQAYEDHITASGIGPLNALADEYTFMESLAVVRGLADMFAVMYPQLQGLDLRESVHRLDVPVYLVDGKYESRARLQPAAEWFAGLQAPVKQRYTFARSGHSAQYEEFDRLHELLVGTIIPASSEVRQ